jgi:hypothetical protein
MCSLCNFLCDNMIMLSIHKSTLIRPGVQCFKSMLLICLTCYSCYFLIMMLLRLLGDQFQAYISVFLSTTKEERSVYPNGRRWRRCGLPLGQFPWSCLSWALSNSFFDLFSRRKCGDYVLDLFPIGIRPPLYIYQRITIDWRIQHSIVSFASITLLLSFSNPLVVHCISPWDSSTF